jgi:hypothetical protein
MKNNSFENISDICLDTVKKCSPEKSIEKISKLINPKTNKKIGMLKALKIYISLVSYTVPYDENVYSHNYPLYRSKIDKNVSRATKYVKIKNDDK